MGSHYGLFISIASICGLVQSIIWLALTVFGSLVYLCAVPVTPYKTPGDFFRVTFVKLYFEGPQCVPNGSYLGEFNEEYRNPEKIKLLAPDVVFAIMVAKIIFDVAHIILSILLYNTNKTGNDEKLRDLVISWSFISLIMSAVDAFFSGELLLDIFSLTRYLDGKNAYSDNGNLRGIQFIPLILGLVSGRLVVFWFWNVGIGAWFLVTALCCRKKLLKGKTEEVESERVAGSQIHIENFSGELRKRFSENRLQYYDKNQSDWDLFSMEAITRFDEGPGQPLESYPHQTLTIPPPDKKKYADSYGSQSKSDQEEDVGRRDQRRQQWEETNVGYVRDDADSERSTTPLEFAEKIDKSDEELTKSIKFVKRPVGKPVSVPIPPPLPKSDSFSC